jgi:hypothetical protein
MDYSSSGVQQTCPTAAIVELVNRADVEFKQRWERQSYATKKVEINAGQFTKFQRMKRS